MIGLPGLSWVMETYGTVANSSPQRLKHLICFDTLVGNTALDYRNY
jgi:hypothetical protein